MADSVECVVVGAGVVGLAIARALALEGREVLKGQDEILGCGGAGFMFENGIMGARDIRCYAIG